MNLIIHNLKVAVRNLMKYKLQTVISVLSIAIGIVTLSFAHSILNSFKLPALFNEPYHDRVYTVFSTSVETEDSNSQMYRILKNIDIDFVKALKRDGGLKCAEQIAVSNGYNRGLFAEFHLPDSTIRKGQIGGGVIDPEYPNLVGLRSAITGEKVKVLKPGEAIISDYYAKEVFQGKNPIGAVQTFLQKNLEFPVTIVDVYEDTSFIENRIILMTNQGLYYCVSESIEEQEPEYDYFFSLVQVVLKPGYTEQQLLKEISERVAPLGFEVGLQKTLDNEELNTIIFIRLLVYFVASLILLAAIIGFLRVQTQLFRMRRRELSLRIVNGANRLRLFLLLLIEVAIPICIAIIVALCLSYLLEEYLVSELSVLISDYQFTINNLWLYSLVIGAALLIVCGIMAWFSLARILKTKDGLAANMRRSRNHLFRNVMLGIQITVSIVFVSCTFITVRYGDKVLKASNIPENDSFYGECLILRTNYAMEPEHLLNAIKRLPDIDKVIMCSPSYISFGEILFNPEVRNKLDNNIYFKTYFIDDAELISFLNLEVESFNRDNNGDEYILLCENLFNKFREIGILDNNALSVHLTARDMLDNKLTVLPIAGIIKSIPYDKEGMSAIIVSPALKTKYDNEYVLQPKPGKGKSLAQEVKKTIEQLEPDIIDKMLFNFREVNGLLAVTVNAVMTGVWILGIISLIICAMSIFSTIALDTRARRKEVAVRKVNGAKSRDIYKMFGRVYIVLILVSLLIAVPVSVMFSQMIGIFATETAPGISVSPVLPIILGIVVVILFIFLIVAWQINKVMQIDPAKIIAKE